MTTTDARRRLLLVEFLNTDRFSQYRSETYPFVQGWARARGVETRWIGFGFDPDRLPTSRYLMALDDADTARLTDAVRAFAPTHVVLNEELDAPLQAAFDAACGPLGAILRTTLGVGDEPRSFERTPTLASWLGVAPPCGPEEDARGPLLLDEAAPDYACTLENDLARRIRPFVQLLAGPGCLYDRPLARNPFFGEVDLDAAHRDFGCAFCGVGRDTRYPYATPAVPLALRQIRAALATCPKERSEGRYVVAGAALFHRMDEFFAAVLEAAVPPSEFLFACRIDELRRKAPHVEALLPRLAAAGHAIAIANMGVENFSPVENERFNKGIDEADVEAIVALTERWEKTFPGTFRFRETGGFGFILFTPWTRVEDLRINLRAAERLGLPADSFFFVSRLQLHRGRPITLLAERDGALLREGDDAVLAPYQTSSIMSVHDHDLPWRFLAPEVAPLYGLFVRLWQALGSGVDRKVDEDDDGLLRVRALLRRLPETLRSPYRLLPLVLDAAEADPAAASAAAGRPGAPVSLVEALETRLSDQLWPEEEARRREEEQAQAAALRDGESAAERERRETLYGHLRAVLPLLAAHASRPLRGFVPVTVDRRPTGAGWGELRVVLERRDRGAVERLGVRVLPRDVAPHGFATTPRFTVMHDADTPVDSDDRRRVLDVVARGLERYVSGRERGRNA